MKSHIQGLFILLGVGIALMVLANIAAPVVTDAFGEDGAIVAESAPEDVIDLASGGTEVVIPLTSEEVALLQANLTDLGFDPGPIDGILGGGTRAAIGEAIIEYQLDSTAANRDVLEYTQSLIDALAAAEAADDPTSDLSLESQGVTTTEPAGGAESDATDGATVDESAG